MDAEAVSKSQILFELLLSHHFDDHGALALLSVHAYCMTDINLCKIQLRGSIIYLLIDDFHGIILVFLGPVSFANFTICTFSNDIVEDATYSSLST